MSLDEYDNPKPLRPAPSDWRACHCGRPYDIRSSAMAQCDDCTSLQEDDEPVTRDRVRCPGCGEVTKPQWLLDGAETAERAFGEVKSECVECGVKFTVAVSLRYESPPMLPKFPR